MNNTDNGRPDMQLASDRDLETIQENARNNRLDKEILAKDLMNKWGTADNGKPLSQIVKSLCSKGGGIYLAAKSDIFKDDDISIIIDDIAISADVIPSEWDEPITSQDQIQVDLFEDGGEVEIIVKLMSA